MDILTADVPPTDRAIVPDAATALAQAQAWREGSAVFAALAARHATVASALRHFGIVHWSERRLDVAARALLCALALEGEAAPLWRDLAGVYEGADDLAKADFCTRRAIDVDPDRSGSWLLLANIARRRNDIAAADGAYRRAIALDPRLADAHFGLGVLHFEGCRFDHALASFRTVVTLDERHAVGQACLGHVLYALGDFAEAAAAFETALRLAPLDAASRRKRARARTLAAMIAGGVQAALHDYPAVAGEDAEPIDTISRDTFALLSAYGHRDAALDIGEIRIAEHPDDPIQRYLLDAVSGHPHSVAPAAYVEAYFDRFAKEFDHKLVEVLRYDVPRRLATLVGTHRTGFADMLDLGCGTGLASPHLDPFGARLVGVDLSSGMLHEAGGRDCYAALVQAEAVTYLREHEGTFDLVFAADLLVYIGDLAPLFEAAAAALRPGGIWALSIETGEAADFQLLSSGRFAHAPAYIERLARPAFDRLDHVVTTIRLEAGRPVEGRLAVFRRRRAGSPRRRG